MDRPAQPPGVHVAEEAGILTIRFCNLARRNAFTPEMRRAAARALADSRMRRSSSSSSAGVPTRTSSTYDSSPATE